MAWAISRAPKLPVKRNLSDSPNLVIDISGYHSSVIYMQIYADFEIDKKVTIEKNETIVNFMFMELVNGRGWEILNPEDLPQRTQRPKRSFVF